MKRFVTILCALAAWTSIARATVYTQPLLLTSYYDLANVYRIAYYDFVSGSAQTVPNDCYLEYDVYVPPDSADFSGGVDMGNINSQHLRDFTSSSGSFIRDQNYLRAHPYSDLSPYAKGQWYHRKFDMGATAGLSFTEVCLSNDTGNSVNGAPSNLSGYYNGYFDNIKLTNAYGTTLLDLFSNASSQSLPGSPVSSSALFNFAGASALNNHVTIASTFAVTALSTSAPVGSSNGTTVTATFTGPSGTPVQGANVRLVSSRSQDQLSPTVGVTDSLGHVTATVWSTLSGPGLISATAGPFSGAVSIQFNAGAPVAWHLKVPNQTFIVGPVNTALQIGSEDSFGNVTSTGRSVVLASSDSFIQLSSDGVAFVAAPTGLTLTPSNGELTFYVRITGGASFRTSLMTATDSSASGGPLTADSASLLINANAAAGLYVYLPSAGTAGAALLLTATALDASNEPAYSTATLTFSSASSTGAFSLDSGFTWVATTSTALDAGSAALLYRDTKAGYSSINISSSLGSPLAGVSITAGAPYSVTGTAFPSAVYYNSADGPNTSTLTAFVLDQYANPVSGVAVAFYAVTGTTGAIGAPGGGSPISSTVTSGALGSSAIVYTVGPLPSFSNYVRATVAGLKPTMINISSAKPTRLNLSPAPATTGVNVSTSFILLAQDNSPSANTGPSSTSVELSSTTSTILFSPDGSTGWTSPLTVTMSQGRAIFYASDSSPTGAAGATITATDLAPSGKLSTGVGNVYIYQAALKVIGTTAQWPNVTRGETGVGVTMTVQNTGGIDANLNASTAKTFPTFNGSTSNYTFTPYAGNPTVAPAGGTVQLFFTVTVGAAAALGSITINGTVTGTDSSNGATLSDTGTTNGSKATWVVADPSSPQIGVYPNWLTPTAGAAFSVTIVATDAAGRTITTYAPGVTLSTRLCSAVNTTATGSINLALPQLVRGIAVFSHSYNISEGVYLKAYAGAVSGNSVGITPVAATFDHYLVFNPSSVIAGAPFALTLTPVDAFGNTRMTLGGSPVTLTARLLNGSVGSSVPSADSFNAASGPVSTLSESYTRAEVLQLIASDSVGFVSRTWEAQTLTVLPAALNNYGIQNPSIGNIGVYFPVTVTAFDLYGNTENTSNAVTVTVIGGSGSLATGWLTLSGGVSIVAETYSQPGSIRLGVTDGSVSSVYGNTTPIVFAAPTATPSFSMSPSPTVSPTPTFSPTSSATPTNTPSPSSSDTPSNTPSPTRTPTPTDSSSITPSPTFTDTSSSTSSPTFSLTGTPTFSATVTPTYTDTASPTATPTFTATPSSSATPTFSRTATPTPSSTVTLTATDTASSTATPTFTDTASSTATPTCTVTPSSSATPTVSRTPTSTASPTATPTVTDTASPSVTPTLTDTATATDSPTSTITGSPTYSVTSTSSSTQTPSPTETSTSSETPSDTATSSATATPSASPTQTSSPSSSTTPTDSDTPTTTPTSTSTGTGSPSFTSTDSETETETPTSTDSPTGTATPTASATSSITPSSTDTPSVTPTATHTPPWTSTVTPTPTDTPSISPTPSTTPTPAFAYSGTNKTILAPTLLRRGDKLRLYFAERPSDCKVDIFNLVGERVARLETGPGGQPVWDPALVSSGIYVLVVETTFESGHWERFRSKVALVH